MTLSFHIAFFPAVGGRSGKFQDVLDLDSGFGLAVFGGKGDAVFR